LIGFIVRGDFGKEGSEQSIRISAPNYSPNSLFLARFEAVFVVTRKEGDFGRPQIRVFGRKIHSLPKKSAFFPDFLPVSACVINLSWL